MSDNFTGPDLFDQSADHLRDAIDPPSSDTDASLQAGIATVYALHALTAAVVMLVNAMPDQLYELDSWREVIPLPPLKECKGKEVRRPECAERHTDDCTYADPPPELKHELLPVGTRVLVSDAVWDQDTRKPLLKNPQAGRISGYDMHKSKYRWQYEFEPGRYSKTDSWAFVDNRVEVHPDGPECPEPPKD